MNYYHWPIPCLKQIHHGSSLSISSKAVQQKGSTEFQLGVDEVRLVYQ